MTGVQREPIIPGDETIRSKFYSQQLKQTTTAAQSPSQGTQDRRFLPAPGTAQGQKVEGQGHGIVANFYI